MLSKLLKNRLWKRKISFLNRRCYITGESLFLKICYRGRKYISSVINGHKPDIDDLWLSQKEFLKKCSSDQI
jgi:hypothetical protein